MALQAQIGSTDVANIALALKEMGRRGRDFTPIMEEVADFMMNITESNFESQGGKVGGWAPLSFEQIAFKARKGYDPRILHMRGDLRRSVTRRGSRGSFLKVGRHSVIMGTTLPYGRTHQRGDPTRNVPRRPFLALSAADKERIAKLFADDVTAPLRALNGGHRVPTYTVERYGKRIVYRDRRTGQFRRAPGRR